MLQTNKSIVIAIDGHSATGKSTVAKTIARIHNLLYIDTGAMYRAVTLFALKNDCFSGLKVDVAKLESLLEQVEISFMFDPEIEQNITFLNGDNVESEIRQQDVAQRVSAVSAIKAVRNKLVALQREIGKNQSIVMDGRDIGTVVFPQADLKIFMTASAEIRAHRRYQEAILKGEVVTFESILENVTSRDRQDESRAESPLRPASDALILDNSAMSREEQFQWIEDKIHRLGQL